MLAVMGLAMRLYGLNWDQGYRFHPDEPFIIVSSQQVHWPQSLGQFLDAANSPLNPHFFAYGSFPIYLMAFLAHVLTIFMPDFVSFEHLALLGRVVSSVLDCGTILLTAWMGWHLVRSEHADHVDQSGSPWAMALLVAVLVTFTPLQLQQSHYCTVDTMLLFFVMLTLAGCVALVDGHVPSRAALLIGLGYGLGMATKTSAAPLAIPIFIAIVLRWRRHSLVSAVHLLVLVVGATGWTFMLAMPYALLDRHNFLYQLSEQGNMSIGKLLLSYTIQFAYNTPYLYQIQDILLWGLGPLLGLTASLGLLWMLYVTVRRKMILWLIPLSWVLIYGAITGGLYVKYVRYMLPIYPVLTLLAAGGLFAFLRFLRRKESSTQRSLTWFGYSLISLVVLATAFQGLAMLNIYSQPNTLIQASHWIYAHIKPASTISYEQGDVVIPVGDNGAYPTPTYHLLAPGLNMLAEDTPEKAQFIMSMLQKSDLLIITSDRSIQPALHLPQRYPFTSRYYERLLHGQLGFHLIAQFENHPNLFGITFNDSDADPSFSIFDHPIVRIFMRNTP
ncbi:hypothetical protein KDA_18010 [Dictyobacter alpinus]|uniref:Glycosyltransferase RgtA/B/C/D-like domain-containing protein n=2 Tax=Dictyobacter alpinus TaxID=2014873 RepID=A0A402B4S1_9CHLR|nr:hypothetical protein KDA_18010 [Dictyobacter alpinus]